MEAAYPKRKLFVIDDHPLLRRGILQLVAKEDDMEVVGTSSNGQAVTELEQTADIDLVLLDLSLKSKDAIETLRVIRKENPSHRVILFTCSNNCSDLIEAFKIGADGYLSIQKDPDELIAWIRDACDGKMVLSDEHIEIMARGGCRNVACEYYTGYGLLTQREREILRMISVGLSNKVIGMELDIAEATVKVHIKHMLKKLGLSSRLEAAVWAVRHSKN